MSKTTQEIHQNRPLSPHLTIYRKQISSVLSILHRFTGVGLFFGVSVLVWWFILLVFSKFDSFYIQYLKCDFIKIPFTVCISFAWFYHLCNGVRHLVWDSGYGFEIKSINKSGWFVVVCSGLMTLIFYLYIFNFIGY